MNGNEDSWIIVIIVDKDENLYVYVYGYAHVHVYVINLANQLSGSCKYQVPESFSEGFSFSS